MFGHIFKVVEWLSDGVVECFFNFPSLIATMGEGLGERDLITF